MSWKMTPILSYLVGLHKLNIFIEIQMKQSTANVLSYL